MALDPELKELINDFKLIMQKFDAYCERRDTCNKCCLSGWFECPYRAMLDPASQLLIVINDNLIT